MATVTEFVLFGYWCRKVAYLLSLQAGKRIINGNVVWAVTIGTLRMAWRCRICLRQHFSGVVDTRLVEHRMTIVFGELSGDILEHGLLEERSVCNSCLWAVAGDTFGRPATIGEIRTEMAGCAAGRHYLAVQMNRGQGRQPCGNTKTEHARHQQADCKIVPHPHNTPFQIVKIQGHGLGVVRA